jgi:hypothetical protein
MKRLTEDELKAIEADWDAEAPWLVRDGTRDVMRLIAEVRAMRDAARECLAAYESTGESGEIFCRLAAARDRFREIVK